MADLSLAAPLSARVAVPPAARGAALGLLAAGIWGAYLASARAGAVSGLEAADVALLRFGVAGLLLLPWLLRAGLRSAAGVGWGRAAALALLAGPPFILIGVGGYAHAPLAHGAVVQPGALTVGGLVLAALLLGERPPAARIAGTAAVVAGLALVAGPGLLEAGATTPLGDAMFAAAGLMWALFTVLSRRWGLGPLAATAAVSVLSAAAYVPLFAATDTFGRLAALPAGELLVQALVHGLLSGVVAVAAFAAAARILGAGRAMVFPALVPLAATVLGVPLAGELPTPLQAAGLAVATAGLLAGALPGRKPAA
jgi:drug/metabolite transporter (DMT)-like permease